MRSNRTHGLDKILYPPFLPIPDSPVESTSNQTIYPTFLDPKLEPKWNIIGRAFLCSIVVTIFFAGLLIFFYKNNFLRTLRLRFPKNEDHIKNLLSLKLNISYYLKSIYGEINKFLRLKTLSLSQNVMFLIKTRILRSSLESPNRPTHRPQGCNTEGLNSEGRNWKGHNSRKA